MGKRRECIATPRAALDATAGALAGSIARFVINPLDVLKIRFQVQLEPIAAVHKAAGRSASKYTSLQQAVQTIVREEGVQGLWRGTLPGQLLYVPYAAVQFVTLQQCKSWAQRRGLANGKYAPLVSFAAGAAAGAAATVASYPFDLLRTTLAAQGVPKVYHDMTAAATTIVRQQGVWGLYKGLSITLIEIVPYSALQFGLYDSFNAAYDRAQTKRHLREPNGPPVSPTPFQRFVCGLAAGTLAKLATHPLDVAKKRFQVAGLQRSSQYGARVTREAVRSLPDCLRQIYRAEGMRGLYKGTLPSVIKAAPAAAVTFTAYGYFIDLLLERFCCLCPE